MKHPIKRLTPEQRQKLLDWFPTGGDRASVCDVVGVTPVQLRLEMKRDPEFAQQVARAEASMELRQMDKVIKATNDEKNWRTSVWWIERRSRERLRGEGRSLSEDNIFDLVDAVARAIAEEIPDADVQRRVIERLFQVVASDAAEPILVDFAPADVALIVELPHFLNAPVTVMIPSHLAPVVGSVDPSSSEALARLAEQLVEQLCRYSPAARSYRRPGLPHDLLEWGRYFLPAYFRLPPSTMHEWLAAELERANDQRGVRLNVLAPRGGAKSTVATFCYVLRCVVEGREPYVWIVSATREQARTHLRHIRAELELNPLLAQAFPRSTGRGPSWRAGAVQLICGVAIEAFGMGQQLRGRRLRHHRPSLIICDDVENDIHVSSPVQRAACRDWFDGVLLKAGDERTNVINLATALHRDSLAMRLGQTPGWKSATFPAITKWPDSMDLWRQWQDLYCNRDDAAAAATARAFFASRRSAMEAGAELLWPDKEGLYDLMRMRADEGPTAFEREKQNSPIDPERCEWPGEYFDHHIWFNDWPDKLTPRVIALDPSKGADARHGDYSAYVLVGMDPHGIVHVEADLARRPTPEMVQQGVMVCRRFAPDVFGVESNQFQELLVNEFAHEFRKQRRRAVPISGIHNNLHKGLRIRRIGSWLAQRRLRFLSRSPSTRLLVDQLRDFPLGDHDDGPDALEMALRLLNEQIEGFATDDGLGDRLIAPVD